MRIERVGEQRLQQRNDGEQHERHHDKAARKKHAHEHHDRRQPRHYERVVGIASLLAAEFRGQRLAANRNVFLNIARVVRHHNQAYANNLGHRPQQHDPIQIARERLVARKRNKAAHNAAAAERAEELATTYSYVRPNGQRDFTVFAENGIGDVSVGENYLAGVSTPDSAMDQWMNLDFARERILNADATTVSVGHYEGGAYGYYWVLIFSYPENSHTDDFRQEVLDLVNVERAKYGLTPLVMGDANLTAAAQKRAEEIATVNSHTRPDGSKCFTVLKEYGVTAAPTGENAAWGSVSPQEVVDAWMQSEGHRANILNPEARAMGVGYYYNSSSTWGHQWIQIFTK